MGAALKRDKRQKKDKKKKKERKKEKENAFEEIKAENLTNLKKETNTQVHEAQRVPNKMNPKKPTPRHTIIIITKLKMQQLDL